MLAVIKTGGKQYKVSEGDKIKIEKIEGNVGETVKFSDILFVGTEKDVKVGTPIVEGVTIEGKILEQDKADKVWGIKHKAKKRYKVKFGHRQPYTKVEIMKIGSGSAKSAEAKTEKVAKPATKKTAKPVAKKVVKKEAK